jgi:hypothetical protein
VTRDERERFVRSQIFNNGSWEQAVQTIVDRWEQDVELNRRDAFEDGRGTGWSER